MPKQILLLGCGRWGANILRDLIHLGSAVSVVDPDAQRRDAALRAGASSAVAHIDSLAYADAIIIATPATAHAQSIREALRFGVPLFVEKPLVTSSAGARALIGERLFVMDKWRYHAGVEELRRIARASELGRVVSLKTTRTQSVDTQSDADAIWTLAPHDLAIAHEILGTMPTALAAVGETCDSGRVGLVGLLRAADVSVVLEISACRWKRERKVVLECEAGTATLIADDVIVIETGNGSETRVVRGDPPLVRELAAFLQYLDGGERPRGHTEDALAGIETIERLRALAGFSA